MGSKKQKQKQKRKQNDGSDQAAKTIADPRFAGVHSDPRFQNVPKKNSKVAIDSRFSRVFSDKNFSSSSVSIDKRGKTKNKSSANTLRHYYRLEEEEKRKKSDTESDDDDDDAEEEVEEEIDTRKGKKPKKPSHEVSESEPSEDSEASESEEEEDDAENGGSESTTDTDTDEEGDTEVYMEEEAEVQEENIPVIEKETHRLAVVNMDWSHVKAVDLYMMLSSFLPKEGQILSVTVYPSEFGLQRMKEEEVHGPVGLFDDENKDDEDEDDEDDDDEIDDEKLRAYEKTRLKYYFAVVECDSIATADYLYKSCDGVEFERSSNVLDLRFIPDTVEFKQPPRDVATEAPADYDGLDFETQALQQSKVRLTWDEDEPHRVKTLKRKFNADQLADLELKEFLASDDGETDDDDDNASEDLDDKKHKKRDLYRSLIQSGGGSDEDGSDDGQDMEVTFNTGLEDISKRILEKKDAQSESVWDAYLRKKREKKKARKNKSKDSSDDESSDTDQEVPEDADDFFVSEPSAKRSKEGRGKRVKKEEQQQDADKETEASTAELELLLADDKETNPGVKGYNLKRMKPKGKKGKQEPDEDKIPTVDYNDPRFSSLFKSPLFALDPTDPQFKRSAAYARQVAAQKHGKTNPGKLDGDDMVPPSDADIRSTGPEGNKDGQTKSVEAQSKKEKLELSSLVRSVKMKAKQVQVPSEGKTSKNDKRSQSRGLAGNKHSLSPSKQSKKKKKTKAPEN